jgi:hypothetical protein
MSLIGIVLRRVAVSTASIVLLASIGCAADGSQPQAGSRTPEAASTPGDSETTPAPAESTPKTTTKPDFELYAGGFRGSAVCGDYEVDWFNPGLKAKVPADATLAVSDEDGINIVVDNERIEFGGYVAVSPTWCGNVLGDGSTVFAYTTFSGGAHCCFTMYVVRLQDSATLLKASLGNAAGLEPNQLDGEGALELVGLSDVFAYFDDLGFAGTPFLPLVFSYDGRRYAETTRQFPDHVNNDLDMALGELDGAASSGDTPRVKTFGLWVFGDYVLLGKADEGLSDVKERAPDDIDAWLDQYASKARKLIDERYSGTA